MIRTTTCRACGAEIMFIRTSGGKSIPVNVGEVVYRQCSGGKLKAVTPNGEVLSAELADDPHTATGIGYISHFATCPAADAFRKPRKSDRKEVAGMIDNRKTCGGCAYFPAADKCKWQRCTNNQVAVDITTARSEACREYAPKEQAPDAAVRKDDCERKGGGQI